MSNITNYDPSLPLPQPEYWLAKPNRENIGKLKHVYNDSMGLRLKDMDDLRLSIPFQFEDEYNHKLIPNPHVNKIKEHYLLKVVFLGVTRWFKINQLTKQSGDSGDEFLIGALSLESELKGKKIRNYSVVSKNCQQVLTDALSSTLWTVGTIDPSFNVTFRDFDVSLKSAVEYIYQDILETFKGSVAQFDTENRTVSIVKESSIGQDLGLRIKFGHYMQSVSKESQVDELTTRLFPIGNDNLTINRTNPSGQEYIDDFSYFIQNGYIEGSLLTSLNNYIALLDSKKPISDVTETGTTNTTIKMTAHGLVVGDYVVNRTVSREPREVLTVPDANTITVAYISGMTTDNEILKYNSNTFSKLLFKKESLQETQKTKETELSNLLTEKLIVLDTLAIQHQAKTIDSYVGVITNNSVTRTLSGLSAADKYLALARISTNTSTTVTLNGAGKSFTANTWTVLGKVTGATSHSVVVNTTQSNVSVKTLIVKVTESEYSTAGNESTLINKYSDDNKQIQIDSKQSEINTIKSDIAAKDTEITSFRTSVSYESNFTPAELDELILYIYSDEYRDENIVDDYDLYEIGTLKLSEINSPAILYKTNIVSFLSSITEQKNWNKLNLADTATVIHDKLGINVAVKITEIEFDFENISVNLTIASNKKTLTRDERAIELIYDSINATKRLNAKLSDWEQTKNNFSTRNDRISVVPADPVIATDGTAIDHVLNDDGSADISFQWSYNGTGDIYDIDGFFVYVFSSSTDNNYVFGSTIARDEPYTVTSDKRAIIFPSVAANKYYTFGIQAYRVVDNDVSISGIIKSKVIQPSIVSENPYRPSANIAFVGAISGTLDGVPTSTVATVATNFNSRNDRLADIPDSPTGLSISHSLNINGSADIKFSWAFSGTGNAYNIDGFLVTMYAKSTSGAYTIGTTPADEKIIALDPTKTSYTAYGVSPNAYYTFGVRAYRTVDHDVWLTVPAGNQKSGDYIVGAIVTATPNPYQPATTPNYTGNVGGTPHNQISKTPVTLVVADGSTSNNINRADYVVPAGSTSANTTINTAISTLPATGGEIVLLDGTYLVSGDILLPSNTSIRGQGNATIIKVRDNLNTNMNVFKNRDSSNVGIKLSGFKIDGNKSLNTGFQVGINLINSASSVIQNLNIVNMRSTNMELNNCNDSILSNNTCLGSFAYGIRLGNSGNCTISNNVSKLNKFDGIFLSNSNGNAVTGNTCQENVEVGISLASSNSNAISGNTCHANTGPGIRLYTINGVNCDNNVITGNSCIQNGEQGIYLSDSDNNTITGNSCSDNSFGVNNTYDNILIGSFCNYNTIQGNVCRRGTSIFQTRYGIAIVDSTCTGNLVINNDLYLSGATGSFSDAGVSTVTTSANRL